MINAMIVYIKGKSGEIYASPVFAEIGKGWGVKSVVLDETNTALILLPLLKNRLSPQNVNYFYIDAATDDGWVKNKKFGGFAEIIENKKLFKALKRGKSVPADWLDIVKKFNPPLPVITKFEIKTERDIAVFNTVCWGLHDANIEDVKHLGKDTVINFNTNREKHIIITFHNVKETDNSDKIYSIWESAFKIGCGCVTWEVLAGFDKSWNNLNEDKTYKIVAERITWELKLD